jgi:hypothetical protein
VIDRGDSLPSGAASRKVAVSATLAAFAMWLMACLVVAEDGA